MSARAATGALGLDPAPGDPGAAEREAARCRRVRTEAASAAARLRGLSGLADAWEGRSARALAERLQALAGALDEAAAVHGEAVHRLVRWAAALAERQTRAEALERAAQEELAVLERSRADAERARLEALRARAGRFSSVVDPAAEVRAAAAAAAAEAEAQAAAARADRALAALERLRGRARRLREEHDDEAERLARDLAPATAAAPVRPGWSVRHAAVVGELADAVGDTGVALGVVGLVPALAPVAVPAAAVATGLAAAGHALARAGGADVGTPSLLLDATGTASGALGLAARGAAVARSATGAGLGSGAGGVALGLAADGDDRPFGHHVPDSGGEALRTALVPAVAVAASAVALGRQEDRARADERERQRAAAARAFTARPPASRSPSARPR